MICIGKEVLGKEFNEIFHGTPLYKFTNSKEIHFGYQYVDGLNVDPNEFDISQGECSKGGLYFTSSKYICKWISNNEYVRNVTIPDNARICIYETKFKADKIIVGPRTRICDSDLFANKEVHKLVVQRNGCDIRFIKDPSEEVQRLAVQQNGDAIEFIESPSEEVQRLAVQQNGYAIKHIMEPSKEIQMLAVQRNSYAIQYIKDPNEEVQRLVVQQNDYAIAYIKNPSKEIQMLIVQQNCHTIKYIKKKKATHSIFFSFLHFFQLV
jgi:hypothetical protein